MADHGEVFTAEREVNAMLDLVQKETERIDSRFLEPACGDGNFLAEVLRRKLAVVDANYRRNPDDWGHYAFLAVTSIYGVELLPDNVEACRERLLSIVMDNVPKGVDGRFGDAVAYVLSKNVLCGDALTMKQADGEPIVFAEWSFVRGDRVKRRDFRFDHILAASTKAGDQLSFLDDDDGIMQFGYDESRKELVPDTVREYPLCDWQEVCRVG